MIFITNYLFSVVVQSCSIHGKKHEVFKKDNVAIIAQYTDVAFTIKWKRLVIFESRYPSENMRYSSKNNTFKRYNIVRW